MSARFVVLEHQWNGVHWDFMLETGAGEALRTWAIRSEIVPGQELPAHALPDHRAPYLDYEGEVSGGRGTVRRIASGRYEMLEWTDDVVRVRLAGDQFTGSVVLRRAVAGGGSDDWVFCLGNFD